MGGLPVGDMFTDSIKFFQFAMLRHAISRTWAPKLLIRPFSSAMRLNSPGGIARAEVFGHRARASTPIIDLSFAAKIGWYEMSGGQQQRFALARALAPKPQVLLLDEPLLALDAKILVSLREEIREIQRQLGITTVFVTHDQEEAMSISDRIVVMNSGRADQIGTPADIYNRPKTRFVAGFVGTMNLL